MLRPHCHKLWKEANALATIGPRATVCHRKQPWFSMLHVEILVLELFAVDAQATCAITPNKVATLDHEAFDDAMKARALEANRLSHLAKLSGTELPVRPRMCDASEHAATQLCKASSLHRWVGCLAAHRKFSAVFGTTSAKSCHARKDS